MATVPALGPVNSKNRDSKRKRCSKREPMVKLPIEYRVTAKNPNPPLLHFGFLISDMVLHSYAVTFGLVLHPEFAPNTVSPLTVPRVMKRLSEEVQYNLELRLPLKPTPDCGLGVVLELYDNYTKKKKQLIEENEENVIAMVQERLGLHGSVRPKWYFDVHCSQDLESAEDSDETVTNV